MSPASSFDVALAAQSLLYSKFDKSGKQKRSLPSDMSYLNTPVFILAWRILVVVEELSCSTS